jgi:hypothetical protein
VCEWKEEGSNGEIPIMVVSRAIMNTASMREMVRIMRRKP